MPIETSIVPAKGIGRKDYSSGVEFSVEPVIRSYQSVYSAWDCVTVPAGADLTVDVQIATGYVAIVYDFYAVIPQHTLLGLAVAAVSGGVVAPIITKQGYGSIMEHLSKGFPLFEMIRFTITNFSDVDLDVDIGAVGIYTDEDHYYLTYPRE